MGMMSAHMSTRHTERRQWRRRRTRAGRRTPRPGWSRRRRLALSLSACAGWGGGGSAAGAPTPSTCSWSTTRRWSTCRSSPRRTSPGDRHQGQLHGAAGERRPRQDQPGVLQPGRPVRRGLAEQLRDPDLRQGKWIAPLDDYIAEGHGVRPGRHPQADDHVAVERRQGLRRAVLRRVVVPHVPQGRPGRQGHHDARQADLARGRRHRRQGRRRRAGHEGHLPARPAGLGPDLRAADHRGQHLRRHLVRRGLDAQVNAPAFKEAVQLLRRPRAGARREGRPAGRLHRVPQQPAPGQRRDVVRRDLGRGLARGRRLPGQGQVRLRAGAGGQDRHLRLAVRLGVGDPGGQHQEGQRLEVHLLGERRSTRSSSATSSAGPGAGRQARLDLREPRVPQGRRRRSPSRPRPPSRPPTPRTRACSRDPAIGIQFVDIPEFPDLGTQVCQDVSSAIAGQTTVDEALETGQELAEDVAERYQARGQ